MTRARMGLRGAIRGRETAFKDDVHWTFFSDHKGSGLRFINLDSGKINTLRYEPADALQRITMVPTEVIGFSPSGRRLILMGSGLDSDKYRTAKSGGIKDAKASILCFDSFQKKPHYIPPPPPERKIGTKIEKVKYPSMHAAILAGDINAVRAMLDSGEDPNQKISMNPAVSDQITTPLRAAAAGYPEIVRLLLEHGADPNTSIPTQNAGTKIILLEAAKKKNRELAEIKKNLWHEIGVVFNCFYFKPIAPVNASLPPTTGRLRKVASKSTVNSVPGLGQRVKSRSLDMIIKPICCPLGIT